MRLLNVHTLKFREFFEKQGPRYCILSHRWGDNELSHKEFRKDVNCTGPGYQKVVDFCSFVRNRKVRVDWNSEVAIDWVWIDTVCIDKRSSAELSEAINSMFKWYNNAAECVILLTDVSEVSLDLDDDDVTQRLGKTSWFSRGWTLQELLAPECRVFVDQSWRIIGHVCYSCDLKGYPCISEVPNWRYGRTLLTAVSYITNIPSKYLTKRRTIAEASIAQRMSWASRRETTRVEDIAYCLLGIFSINMPLLYGEGNMAFVRLQEEIIKRSTDESIFAWKPERPEGYVRMVPCLASSPSDFETSRNMSMTYNFSNHETSYVITNRGLQIESTPYRMSPQDLQATAGLLSHDRVRESEVFLLPLNCYDAALYNDDELNNEKYLPFVLAVQRTPGGVFRIHYDEEVARELSRMAVTKGSKRQFTIPAY